MESQAAARNTVKMSETRDFIPYGDWHGASEEDSAGGSVEPEIRCERMQETPDYIKRSAARQRMPPVELFSALSPPVECGAAVVGGEGGMSSATTGEVRENETVGGRSKQKNIQIEEGNGQLKQQYSLLLREKEECRRLLEDLMRESELKTRECREGQETLHDMKMELMRKSMHVGSLASAVEGQVKEKSRLCQLVTDFSQKFKVFSSKANCLHTTKYEQPPVHWNDH